MKSIIFMLIAFLSLIISSCRQGEALSLIKTEKIIIKPFSVNNVPAKHTRSTCLYVGACSHFQDWGLDRKQTKNEEIAVDIYKVKEDIKFRRIFKSLNSDLDKLCLTKGQIVYFCEAYFDYLYQGDGATLFLFKEKDELFIALVVVRCDSLYVFIDRFERGNIWHANYAHRLVVAKNFI